LDETQTIEWVGLADLYPNPANPRLNDAAVGPVADSLRRFGWQQPIVAKPSGEVVAGHTRLRAAEKLGLNRIPVLRFSGSDLDAVAYGIADNKTASIAEWDEPALAKLLAQLQAEDALEGVGFSDAEIAALLRAAETEVELDDPGPGELPADPVTQPGDLWLLGPHRVLCGDATRAEDLARVTDGRLADLVWTDAPYGVSYSGGTDEALTIQNDELRGPELERFLSQAFGATLAVTKPGSVWYVAAPAGPQFLEFAKALSALGIWRQTLVWVKDSLVLGHSDFHYRHEALFYGWKPGASHREPPDRKGDTVWECPRPRSSPDHPTMKPLPLVQRALEASSVPGELVLDPFMGSGTTLLAAESCGRVAAGLELDPRYADVGVRRWEEATGGQAVLDGSGAPFAEIARERRGAG